MHSFKEEGPNSILYIMAFELHPSLPRRFLNPPKSPQIHALFAESHFKSPETDYSAIIDISFDTIDFLPKLYEPNLESESLSSPKFDNRKPFQRSLSGSKFWDSSLNLVPDLEVHRTRSWNLITKLRTYLGLKTFVPTTSPLSSASSSLSYLCESNHSFLPVSIRVPISSESSDKNDLENANEILQPKKKATKFSDDTVKFDSYAHLLMYNSRSRIAPPSSVIIPVFASSSIRASASYAVENQSTRSTPIQAVKRTLSRTFSREPLRQLSQSNAVSLNKSILKSKINSNFEKEKELSLKVDKMSLEEFLFLFEVDHQQAQLQMQQQLQPKSQDIINNFITTTY